MFFSFNFYQKTLTNFRDLRLIRPVWILTWKNLGEHNFEGHLPQNHRFYKKNRADNIRLLLKKKGTNQISKLNIVSIGSNDIVKKWKIKHGENDGDDAGPLKRKIHKNISNDMAWWYNHKQRLVA